MLRIQRKKRFIYKENEIWCDPKGKDESDITTSIYRYNQVLEVARNRLFPWDWLGHRPPYILFWGQQEWFGISILQTVTEYTSVFSPVSLCSFLTVKIGNQILLLLKILDEIEVTWNRCTSSGCWKSEDWPDLEILTEVPLGLRIDGSDSFLMQI